LEKHAERYVSKAVVFGVRPEHLTAVAEGTVSVPATFTVEFVEKMGAEAIIHLKSRTRNLTARV
jgi:ABC-type sugar transport system ATPase subunit